MLAKEAVKKYQLLSGKVTSVEYSGQGYQENQLGDKKNTEISFQVRSDQGEVVQISFSRYNKELLMLGYNSWVKEVELQEKRIEQELQVLNKDVIITEEQR
ncbi:MULTISPECIES: hypothetical protein [unclassified Lysinibacillus]|uniref:hypothetical protein n=1 Tax=unclassified Lysinibacillus TaxID=2636778 RepID=UPI002012A529|nr:MULTISPECIES: hypothetical protein [unclassified Lysinibacillus]MCL1696657.1 hypothetical protein [Lysinibacillus sp. BPa_S21]MCL1698862.1 hypothetical protein [Lysinibacillus sp. Bpr_S20]